MPEQSDNSSRTASPRGAAILMLVGFGILAANHLFGMSNDGRIFPFLVFLGAILVVHGIAALAAPGTLYTGRTLQDGKPEVKHPVVFALLVLGLVVGWVISHFVYHVF